MTHDFNAFCSGLALVAALLNGARGWYGSASWFLLLSFLNASLAWWPR